MSRKLLVVLVLIAVLFQAITGSVVEAGGPGNGKGNGNGHTEKEEKNNGKGGGSSSNSGNNGGGSSSNNGGGGSSESPSSSGSSGSSEPGPQGNGNTGSSKTRKGLDDEKMNQNIYQTGDTLSYHVKNMHEGEYTIVVKEPGKNGEVVFTTTVYVNADGTLNVELTDIPEGWSGVYQVQIVGADGHMKNDNINIKRKHITNPETLPGPETPETLPGPETPEALPGQEPVETAPARGEKPVDDGDCVTVVYHASSILVTVVEFFRPEDAQEPWLHEDTRLGESRVDSEGAVVARFAGGVTFVVFEYDENTGGYEYRGTGEVIGDYERPIDIWSDGDASSVLFDALIWTPVGAN